MANRGSIASLLTEINAFIRKNGQQEITGDVLNSILVDMVDTLDALKQALLESGLNIKTINQESLLGEGDIEIQGSDVDIVDDLESTRTDAALSANQGRVLNSTKEDKSFKVTYQQTLFADMKAAYEAGKKLYLVKSDTNGDEFILPLVSALTNEYRFQGYVKHSFQKVFVTSDNQWTGADVDIVDNLLRTYPGDILDAHQGNVLARGVNNLAATVQGKEDKIFVADLSTSYAEIVAAYNAGRKIYLNNSDDEGYSFALFPLTAKEGEEFRFSLYEESLFMTYKIDSEDNWVYSDRMIVDNLNTTTPGNFLDARQGRVLDWNKVDKVAGKGLSTNDYTTTDKDKLSALPTASELSTSLAGKQATISDLDDIRSGAALGATALQEVPSGYATDEEVATAVGAEATRAQGVEAGLQTALANKANKDGYYEQMGVGLADNLAGRGDGVSAEFTRRTSGGAGSIADGFAVIKKIKGKTLVWNQLVKDGWIYNRSESGVTITKLENGAINLNGTSTAIVYLHITNVEKSIVGHKYLAFLVGQSIEGDSSLFLYNDSGNISTEYANPCVAQASAHNYWYVRIAENTTLDNVKVRPVIIDLTAMGIADSISTPADFKALFPLPYYDYNAGQLLSFKGEGIVTDGFNQFNDATAIIGKRLATDGSLATDATFACSDFIKVFGNTAYYFCGLPNLNDYVGFIWFDADKNIISYDGTWDADTTNHNLQRLVTSPTNAAFVRINTKIANIGVSTCVNLSWSGYRDGEYEPYWQETRNLPITTIKGKVNGEGASEVIFPDGMKSAGTAHDEIVGNKAIKRIGVVDLGDANWHAGAIQGTSYKAQIVLPINASADYHSPEPVDAPLYWKANGGYYYDEYAIGRPNDAYLVICVPTSVASTLDELKEWLQGKHYYYELAEPVEYIIDEADVPNYKYKVSDFGTETIIPEGLDTSGVPKTAPFNGNIVYGMNAVDTLRRLPEDYISKASMESILSALVSAGVIASYTLTWDETNNKYNCTINA